MTGRQASELVADPGRFHDCGGTLKPHRRDLVYTDEDIAWLANTVELELERAAERWNTSEGVRLQDEIQSILTFGICRWAGIQLEKTELSLRANELSEFFNSAASLAPPRLCTRVAKRNAAYWMAEAIKGARILPEPDCEQKRTALEQVAWLRDDRKELLGTRAAALHMLELISPIAAISALSVFSAVALHTHPACLGKMRARNSDYCDHFIKEVKRFYPLLPAVRAIVSTHFLWQGYEFHQGERAILDVYGTNHDSREWDKPSQFKPERFENQRVNANKIINSFFSGARLTDEVLKRIVLFLVSRISYEVQPQDLDIAWDRVPAVPTGGFVMANVTLL